MMQILTPTTEDEVSALVREAAATHARIRIEGGGTRAGLGRPVEADAVLTSAGLIGITLHEPAELVISARAGTKLAEVEAALAAHNQMLPFEPMDHRGLYGGHGEPTAGGLVATNASGPRRIAAGAVRDHLIGIRFVNGSGEVIKSGGRVMKNVTGLDLVKLQCGAHGTLGFLTEVTFKVLPRPESAATLAWNGLEDASAVEALTAAMGSPFEVTGAAHIPAGPGRPRARTLLRLEGFGDSVEHRCSRVAALLGDLGACERLDPASGVALWGGIRDGRLLDGQRDAALWRVSVAPARGPEVVARVRAVLLDHCYDWAGGLLTLAVAPEDDAGASVIRSAVGPVGGHATLLRAPDAIRTAIEVFEPLTAPLAALTERVRASLDPGRIFNPGRMRRVG